jgi:hypothetical protein
MGVTARQLGASVTDLVLALVAEALGRVMAGSGEPTAGQSVRAMVPCTLRTARRGQPRRGARDKTARAGTATGASPGNRTTGILLDLPTGPMPLAQRVAAIRAMRRARLSRGDADAAAFVLHSMKLMPPARAARLRTGGLHQQAFQPHRVGLPRSAANPPSARV